MPWNAHSGAMVLAKMHVADAVAEQGVHRRTRPFWRRGAGEAKEYAGLPMAKPARDFIDDLQAAPDGLPVRGAGAHTRDKLGILRYYVPGFTTACKGKSPEFYFVDGLAGEGIYEFGDDGSQLVGSTLISLEWGVPPFTKCVAMDLDARKIDALRRRTADYGDRAVVERGDCNFGLLAWPWCWPSLSVSS